MLNNFPDIINNLIDVYNVLKLSTLYALLFAFIDIYYIKQYRNLTKADKRKTIVFKSIFVAITSCTIIIKVPFLLPTLLFGLSLLFDSLMGLYIKNKMFYVGSEAVLDDFADNIDGVNDNNAKVYWFIRLVLLITYSLLYTIYVK